MRYLLALLLPMIAASQTAPPVVMPPQLSTLAQLINDFGNTHRYAAENATVKLPAPGEQRVVFMGDSITDNWGHNPRFGGFFPGKPYINRGIGGQVTAQMLLRYYQDVIALKPKVVLILGGTNDIGGNIGPTSLEVIENNLMSMVDMSKANNIKVILAALTPVCDCNEKSPQTPKRPPEKIIELNRWIKAYCAQNGLVYLDYYSPTIDDKGLFRAELTDDGLHPTAKGYEIMGPLAEKAIAEALAKR